MTWPWMLIVLRQEENTNFLKKKKKNNNQKKALQINAPTNHKYPAGFSSIKDSILLSS